MNTQQVNVCTAARLEAISVAWLVKGF